MLTSAFFTVFSALACIVQAASPAQWRSRSIYQVLTDRFARSDGSTTAACDPSNGVYCGGTYQGIINQLDYIQGMGFTAIWISPIVANIETTTGYGQAYHGYWAQDIYSLNPHFGTAAELHDLVSALHARDMYLMVDVAPNHFGYDGPGAETDYSTLTPFNKEEYFHPLCWISNYDDQVNVEDCWLGDNTVALPDVNTTNPIVQSTYNAWITALVSNHTIDGLRIDTVKHVAPAFWTSFTAAAGVYAVGEVYHGDAVYTCPYQAVVDGVLNYPVYYPLVRAFSSTTGSIAELVRMVAQVKELCEDSTLGGSFTENHDLPRFASMTEDYELAKNVLAYNIMGDGIPIIYQGQEQHYSGASDPTNREAVWLSGYNTTSPLYRHIAALNQIRNRAIYVSGESYTTHKAVVLAYGSSYMVLRKGDIITVLTNAGSGGTGTEVSVRGTGYEEGVTVVDVLGCMSLTVGTGGDMGVVVVEGAPKVYYPSAQLAGSGICGL